MKNNGKTARNGVIATKKATNLPDSRHGAKRKVTPLKIMNNASDLQESDAYSMHKNAIMQRLSEFVHILRNQLLYSFHFRRIVYHVHERAESGHRVVLGIVG